MQCHMCVCVCMCMRVKMYDCRSHLCPLYMLVVFPPTRYMVWHCGSAGLLVPSVCSHTSTDTRQILFCHNQILELLHVQCLVDLCIPPILTLNLNCVSQIDGAHLLHNLGTALYFVSFLMRFDEHSTEAQFLL